MKAIKLISIALFVFVAAGCSSTGHLYGSNGQCLTCFNNPLTKEPINHDGTTDVPTNEAAVATAKANPAANHPNVPTMEYSTTLNSPLDVDIAFLRIKREFGFLSEQEVKNEWGSAASFKLRARDYRWEAYPGISYQMGSERLVEGKHIPVVIVIDRNEHRASKITIRFITDPMHETKAEIALKTRVNKALRAG